MFEWIFLFTYVMSATEALHDIEIPLPNKFNIGNIALELVLDDKLENNNTKIMLSDSDKTDIEPNINSRRIFKTESSDKLTDFIQIVTELLKTFDDADLELFFKILYEEIGKYHYNGCKFHELTDNDALKKFINSQLADIKNIPADNIREKISKLSSHIENTKYNLREKEFTYYIDSLYKHDSVKKFNKFLIDLDKYRLKAKTNLDLNKIIRNGLRSIIFNHYTKLDYNTRASLKLKLHQYAAYYITEIPLLRSQPNPTEFRIFGNKNKDDGKFYDAKDSIDMTQPKRKEYIPYPKLAMDWEVSNSVPENDDLILKKKPKITTSRFTYTEESIVSLDTLYIANPTVEKHVMEQQKYISEANFMEPSHKRDIIIPVTQTLTTNKNKPKNTEIAVTQPLPKVVTMVPFVPKIIGELKDLKYDMKNPSVQPDLQVQYPANAKYTSLNKKSTVIKEGLSAEELEYRDSLIDQRRHDDNHKVPETVPIDKDLFERLQKLENELSNIDMQAYSDTEMIQVLKHDTKIVDNTNTKSSQEHYLKKE